VTDFIRTLFNLKMRGAKDGAVIFVAVWLFGAALFLFSFLNLKTEVQQGFISVSLAADGEADYGLERDRVRFHPFDMDVIRLAILDQLGNTEEASQHADQAIALLQSPIPSVQSMAIDPGDLSARPEEATPTPTEESQPTRKPTKTDRPSHTPRPTHTPRDHPVHTSTAAFNATETSEPESTATPGPPVTRKPTKTPKPTKTQKE
jgi:hypothetical protein